MAHNVQEVLGPAAAAKGLDLRIDTGGAPDWFIGDATRLSQILMNLIGNAVKFTSAGEVRLTVARKPASGGRAGLVFTIRDQGIGIPAEAMGSLFKSFSQVDATTTRRFGGTGLGLAICKGLVESMGGGIRAESLPGRGSVFTFELELPVGTQPAAAEPSVSGDGPISAIKPMRILIAEDNRVNQLVAMKWTERLGYQADLAANGLEVLRMLKSKEYDLILMDCQMPEMDGFETTRRILATVEPERRPIIFALTAAVLEEERSRCLDAGMTSVLQKPIKLRTLRQAILDCPMRAAWDANATPPPEPLPR